MFSFVTATKASRVFWGFSCLLPRGRTHFGFLVFLLFLVIAANAQALPFTDIGAGLPGVGLSSVEWGDQDNDGDLDILLTGTDVSSNTITRVYRNDGAGRVRRLP